MDIQDEAGMGLLILLLTGIESIFQLLVFI